MKIAILKLSFFSINKSTTFIISDSNDQHFIVYTNSQGKNIVNYELQFSVKHYFINLTNNIKYLYKIQNTCTYIF